MNVITKANSLQPVALLLDNNRGVYIPQNFVQEFDLSKWEGIAEKDKAELLNGPDSEWYNEAWTNVLDNATFSENGNTWRLTQDGDLWAYCPELMTRQEKKDFLGDDETPYQFEELSENAKEKARDWYREGSLHYDWFDSVYEDANSVADILGITLDTKRGNSPAIYFSGFSSQGDGACFEGSYRYAKGAVKAIKAYAPQDAELARIAKALQDIQKRQFYRLRATCKQRGHYQHSGCMSIEVWNDEDQYKDIGNAEDEITQALRDFADWIYSQLEKEYEWLNSDEQVDEMIIANEYEFDEDGNIN